MLFSPSSRPNHFAIYLSIHLSIYQSICLSFFIILNLFQDLSVGPADDPDGHLHRHRPLTPSHGHHWNTGSQYKTAGCLMFLAQSAVLNYIR